MPTTHSSISVADTNRADVLTADSLSSIRWALCPFHLQVSLHLKWIPRRLLSCSVSIAVTDDRLIPSHLRPA